MTPPPRRLMPAGLAALEGLEMITQRMWVESAPRNHRTGDRETLKSFPAAPPVKPSPGAYSYVAEPGDEVDPDQIDDDAPTIRKINTFAQREAILR